MRLDALLNVEREAVLLRISGEVDLPRVNFHVKNGVPLLIAVSCQFGQLHRPTGFRLLALNGWKRKALRLLHTCR